LIAWDRAERAFMLQTRARIQRGRVPTRPVKTTAFSPLINRHTGKPHVHARAKARRLSQIGSPA
jgi:hypothetical protein